jgi:hypothetical protein
VSGVAVAPVIRIQPLPRESIAGTKPILGTCRTFGIIASEHGAVFHELIDSKQLRGI